MDPGELRVAVTDARGRPVRAPGLASWLCRTAPSGARGSICIALVSDARMRVLNRLYRGTDRPTDVLSFPADHPDHLGDVVIARGVAARQARTCAHSTSAEWRILALHGLLHLLGYDHHVDGGRMRRVERRLLLSGGLRDGLIDRAQRRRRTTGPTAEHGGRRTRRPRADR